MTLEYVLDMNQLVALANCLTWATLKAEKEGAPVKPWVQIPNKELLLPATTSNPLYKDMGHKIEKLKTIFLKPLFFKDATSAYTKVKGSSSRLVGVLIKNNPIM